MIREGSIRQTEGEEMGVLVSEERISQELRAGRMGTLEGPCGGKAEKKKTGVQTIDRGGDGPTRGGSGGIQPPKKLVIFKGQSRAGGIGFGIVDRGGFSGREISVEEEGNTVKGKSFWWRGGMKPNQEGGRVLTPAQKTRSKQASSYGEGESGEVSRREGRPIGGGGFRKKLWNDLKKEKKRQDRCEARHGPIFRTFKTLKGRSPFGHGRVNLELKTPGGNKASFQQRGGMGQSKKGKTSVGSASRERPEC